MSYGRFVELYCDGPGESGKGCPASHSDMEPTVREARVKARSDGWVVRDGLDLCPDCRKRRPRDER